MNYIISDFTDLEPVEKVNLILANPPYVRQHYISNKLELVGGKVLDKTGIKLSGLSGLYIYFILLSHDWLEDGGIACWLIPSEFLDVNYGEKTKRLRFIERCNDSEDTSSLIQLNQNFQML